MRAKYIKEDPSITVRGGYNLKIDGIYDVLLKNDPEDERIWMCAINNGTTCQCEYHDLYIFLKHWQPQCMTMAYEE